MAERLPFGLPDREKEEPSMGEKGGTEGKEKTLAPVAPAFGGGGKKAGRVSAGSRLKRKRKKVVSSCSKDNPREISQPGNGHSGGKFTGMISIEKGKGGRVLTVWGKRVRKKKFLLGTEGGGVPQKAATCTLGKKRLIGMKGKRLPVGGKKRKYFSPQSGPKKRQGGERVKPRSHGDRGGIAQREGKRKRPRRVRRTGHREKSANAKKEGERALLREEKNSGGQARLPRRGEKESGGKRRLEKAGG